MSTLYDIIKRPIVTEKGVAKKDAERTLCFEVAPDANKTQIKNAVQTVFKVKVEDVRTSTTAGNCAAGAVLRDTVRIGKRRMCA